MARAGAGRRQQEAEEARKTAQLQVQRKRFEALDKQLLGLEQQLSKLVDKATFAIEEHQE